MKTVFLKQNTNYLLQAKAVYSPNDLANSLAYELKFDPTSNAEPEVIDLSDYYLLPAFCDCHTHLALSGFAFEEHLDWWHDEQRLMELYRANLARTFRAGVLTIREGGDPNDRLLRFIAETPHLPVTILTPGHGLSKTGFYGGFITHQSADVNEAVLQMHQLKAAGASHCKIFLSGLISFKTYGQVGKIQWTQKELDLLVATAHQLELAVMIHANSPAAIQMAIEAGVDSIEHGYYITQQQILELAQRQIAWVPTVVPVAKQQQAFPVTTQIVQEQLAKVRFAVDQGVPVGIGTDAGAGGVLHGIGYHEEMALFSEAGLSHRQILTLACLVSRAICRAKSLKFLLYLQDPMLPTTDLKSFVGTILPE